ncbi:MAG TPA: hypothetical protein VG308_02950 [Stellaceae bacterium]|nr:hypothetical protein [Stellaceae bacterium]
MRRLDRFERRLAVLNAMLHAWSAERRRENREHKRHLVLAAMLRGGLQCAGIDPGEAPALRRLETPEPPPRRFVHPLRRLAERRRPRPLIEVLDALTARYHKGPAPDLHQASAMQLIGYYCFGDGAAREAPA